MQFKEYLKRHTRFIELWTYGQWNIKVYYITEYGNEVDYSFISIAKEITHVAISETASSDNHYHTAILTVHTSESFNQIIFDWWADDNELRHLVYKAENTDPRNFTNITHSGKAFCIWELKVLSFERDSWKKYILTSENPNFVGYYSDVLEVIE